MNRSIKTTTCWLALIASAHCATARADAPFKITPDVVYGHKAGMALTFDVIYPKESKRRRQCCS